MQAVHFYFPSQLVLAKISARKSQRSGVVTNGEMVN